MQWVISVAAVRCISLSDIGRSTTSDITSGFSFVIANGSASIAFTASTLGARVPNIWFSRPQVRHMQALCLLVHKGLRQWGSVSLLSLVRCRGEEKAPERQACLHQAD